MTRFPSAPDRCAVRADERGDAMLGTAFPAARLLLVEQPFPWGFQGLRSSHFDAETALALEARCRAEGIRVQAIRRPGKPPHPEHRRWMLVDTRRATRSVRSGEFAHDDELLELPLAGSRGEPDDEPLYLVCTHGRHDPCCASRGRPLIVNLAAAQPGRVWQSSHLGGCRFAPTVLVLPLGLMYGRVPPSAAAQLMVATQAGEVLPEFLRGRIGIPPAAQAALGFAHEHLGLQRVDDLEVVRTAAGAVLIESPRGRLEVSVRRQRVDAAGLTCAAPGASFYVAHRPAAVESTRPRSG